MAAAPKKRKKRRGKHKTLSVPVFCFIIRRKLVYVWQNTQQNVFYTAF